jgi:predicted acyltransferase
MRMAEVRERTVEPPVRADGAGRGDRIVAIDQFRGLSIVLMVIANYLSGVSGIPNWLKHAPDLGLTPPDVVAPLFLFAIGLTYRLSAERRRARTGHRETTAHLFRRYLAILGVGAIITGVQDYTGVFGGVGWGVLQAIGMAGLLALPTVYWPPAVKCGAGLGILTAYQYLLDRYWVSRVLQLSHGGLPGSLAWGAMLILAMGLADLYHERRSGLRLLGGVLVCAALGVGLSFLSPVSKNRVSAAYVLVSVAISGAVYLAFHWALARRRLSLLVAWGQNPLLLYVLHMVLLGAFVLPPRLGWYAMAGWPLIAVQLSLLMGALSAVAWYLYRKGWTLAL